MEAKYCLLALLVSITLAGCDAETPRAGSPPPASSPGPAAAGPDGAPVVMFLGTSLTAGYGLDPGDAFPARIQAKLDSAGWTWRVVNAGVSGETSAGALRRLDWLLAREHPAVLVIETGANDGLRGLPPDTLEANLLAIARRARALEPAPRLVFLEMEAPPELGDRYTRRFREVYTAVAQRTNSALVPFFLEGVAGIDSLNQPDRIHPTPQGHAVAADNLWQTLREVLRPR